MAKSQATVVMELIWDTMPCQAPRELCHWGYRYNDGTSIRGNQITRFACFNRPSGVMRFQEDSIGPLNR